MDNQFEQYGYVHVPRFLTGNALGNITSIVERYHAQWMSDYQQHYQGGLINSAYLTRGDKVAQSNMRPLFELVAGDPLFNHMTSIFPSTFVFMNCQLFFNPYNPQQNNYWHRDGQYHLDLEQQKQALASVQVLHCRIALRDEPGIELVPGTHTRWDTPLELSTRLETDGRFKHEALPNTHIQPMAAGDLLIFSANMLHRGLYGNDRLALDILYCENEAHLTEHIDRSCYPSDGVKDGLQHPEIFES